MDKKALIFQGFILGVVFAFIIIVFELIERP